MLRSPTDFSQCLRIERKRSSCAFDVPMVMEIRRTQAREYFRQMMESRENQLTPRRDSTKRIALAVCRSGSILHQTEVVRGLRTRHNGCEA